MHISLFNVTVLFPVIIPSGDAFEQRFSRAEVRSDVVKECVHCGYSDYKYNSVFVVKVSTRGGRQRCRSAGLNLQCLFILHSNSQHEE